MIALLVLSLDVALLVTWVVVLLRRLARQRMEIRKLRFFCGRALVRRSTVSSPSPDPSRSVGACAERRQRTNQLPSQGIPAGSGWPPQEVSAS